MVLTTQHRRNPLSLVVTGEAETWQNAIQQIVGPQWLTTHRVSSDRELLEVVESGQADAAVLDDETDWNLDVMRLLRMIRRINEALPVVVVTQHRDRVYLENALRLAAFSVVVKPLALEDLLRQIHRIMDRLNHMLRFGGQE